jgi:hypothetical protein
VKRWIGTILLIGFFLVSCTSQLVSPETTTDQDQPSLIAGTLIPTLDDLLPSGTTGDVPTQQGTSNCATEEVNQLGASIAQSYDFTTSREVMAWYCSGAEFEDILVALQTEEITGTPAEDMLAMRADGLSWEEIWLMVGLYDS